MLPDLSNPSFNRSLYGRRLLKGFYSFQKTKTKPKASAAGPSPDAEQVYWTAILWIHLLVVKKGFRCEINEKITQNRFYRHYFRLRITKSTKYGLKRRKNKAAHPSSPSLYVVSVWGFVGWGLGSLPQQSSWSEERGLMNTSL